MGNSARLDWWLNEDLAEVQLKISGCPIGCGHHYLTTIGLYGASRKINRPDVQLDKQRGNKPGHLAGVTSRYLALTLPPVSSYIVSDISHTRS